MLLVIGACRLQRRHCGKLCRSAPHCLAVLAVATVRCLHTLPCMVPGTMDPGYTIRIFRWICVFFGSFVISRCVVHHVHRLPSLFFVSPPPPSIPLSDTACRVCKLFFLVDYTQTLPTHRLEGTSRISGCGI